MPRSAWFEIAVMSLAVYFAIGYAFERIFVDILDFKGSKVAIVFWPIAWPIRIFLFVLIFVFGLINEVSSWINDRKQERGY